MSATNIPKPREIADFKRTKIIATVGPATNSYETITELIKLGANGLRLNFSHGNHDERDQQIKWIRQASEEQGKPVAIIQDLQGPKIRLGDFDDIINVQKDQALLLKYKSDYAATGIIPTQYDLSKIVKKGEKLYLFDGKIKSTVTSVIGEVVHIKTENSGILLKRKSINLPDTSFEGNIITKKDREDIAYGSTHDIDYVALSFIQTAEDIEHLRRLLRNVGSSSKVIAKVETKTAIENLEAIVKASDAVMIARGDLAVETAPESVPIVQRKIIGLGRDYAKPTIVATQMLASMVDAPEPTRAEISDVATAVILGADCVMLSDETANGQYPLESVTIMKRIILYTEKNNPVTVSFPGSEEATTPQTAICKAAIALASDTGAVAIIAETKSGSTALQISSRRPLRPLVVVTPDQRVARQLSIVYGTKSYVRPDDKLAALKLTNWLREKNILKKGDMVVSASGKYPGIVGTTDTIKVRILE